MRYSLTLLVVLLLTGCERTEDQVGSITAYSTGMDHPDFGDSIIQCYGSHAIRVKDAPVEMRIYKIENGNKELNHEFVLDPKKHPMAWVTPSIKDGDAIFEFGIWEEFEGSGSTPHYITTFEGPKRVGHNTRMAAREPDAEQYFLSYSITTGNNVSLMLSEINSIPSMIETSKKKAVAFYIVTVDRSNN